MSKSTSHRGICDSFLTSFTLISFFFKFIPDITQNHTVKLNKVKEEPSAAVLSLRLVRTCMLSLLFA